MLEKHTQMLSLYLVNAFINDSHFDNKMTKLTNFDKTWIIFNIVNA